MARAVSRLASHVSRLTLLAFLFAAPATAQSPRAGVVAWNTQMKGAIAWQQVSPAGALLVSTDASLAGVDLETGKLMWEKPELGGLPVDSIRPVEGSLLMEAARPGFLQVFDPVTGTIIFDSQVFGMTQVVTRRVLPQTGTLLVHGRMKAGDPAVLTLYDLATGERRWVNDTLFQESGPPKKGFGGLLQGLKQMASEATALEVLQAGPDMIVVNTLTAMKGLDARTGAERWRAVLPVERKGSLPRHVRLFPSMDKSDRIYVGFDDRVMAYRLADGQPLWQKPAEIDGWVFGVLEHPDGLVILPESPPPDQATGNVKIINGVVQTGLSVARYADGTTINAKPLRMRGTVRDALLTGGSAVLAVDAESRTFVNVLDVATASVRLKKDVKIKGQLEYAELTPAGLLYISRPDASTNAEVNIIDLASGEQRFKDAIESGKKPLYHAVEGNTLYVFANKDRKLYAVDRDAGNFKALTGEIKFQGGEEPASMEIRPAGIVISSSQNLAIIGRDGQVKQQVYHPAPQLPGLLRALYRVNSIRAGLYGAAASAYGDAFAQASRNASDPMAKRITAEMSVAYTDGGRQLTGYSKQASALASRRFKASLAVPGAIFMLTKAPEGNGNVLLQVDKETGQSVARVDLGKEKEPVYAVDDVSGMLFLQTGPGKLVGYRL